MATKLKTDTTTPHDDFKTMPSTMPTSDAPAEVQEPRPVVPETPKPDATPTYTDEVLVSSYHKLSPDEARRVEKIKSDFGGVVSYLKTLRDAYHDAEVQRMFAVAITNAETASMWAVRGVTHRG